VLRRRIVSRRASVAVVGQGYVGVSLACGASEAGFRVVGVDVDAERIAALARGVLSVPGVNATLFQAGFDAGNVTFTTDAAAIKGADVVLICVPTPVRDHTPDLSFVEQASRDVAEGLSAGSLVVLESTTYPGTTEELVRPILETSGLSAGRDFALAFSPERIDPGRTDYDVRTTPKLLGGITERCAERARELYSLICDEVHVLSTPEAAELAKLLENIFRSVNIALVNELAQLCDRMGIDVWEVVEAAATKPFGFMSFRPGPGLGGHCIPIDPFYLTWKAREYGFYTEFIELAGKVNESMPYFCRSLVSQALNHSLQRSLKGSKILVVGVAYKPDISDTRESPAVKLIALLENAGSEVDYHDPHVPTLSENGVSLSSVPLDAGAYDCVVVVTNHSAIDYAQLVEDAGLVVDLRNATGADGRRSDKVWML
jgi:UDP-N-acetyl-D-glucosamine dehydrogenase